MAESDPAGTAGIWNSRSVLAMYQSQEFKRLLEIKRRRAASLDRRAQEKRWQQSAFERERNEIERRLDTIGRSVDAALPLRQLLAGQQVEGKQLHNALARTEKLRAQALDLSLAKTATEQKLLIAADALSQLEQQLAQARRLVHRAEVTAEHVHHLDTRDRERRTENAAELAEEEREGSRLGAWRKPYR